MRCPVCDVDLLPSPVRGVYVDGCPGCFGSFCAAETLLVEVVLESVKKGPLECPVCESPMLRGTKFKGRLTLDRCSECAGVWFDAYELDRFAQLEGVEAVVGASRTEERGNEGDAVVLSEPLTSPSGLSGAAPERSLRGPLSALLAVCALYGVVLYQGSNPLAVFNRIVAARVIGWVPWPERFLRPGVLLEGLVRVEAYFLWFTIAFLTVFVLSRFLSLAVPTEEADSAGSPPPNWRRHETEASDPNPDEEFTSCSRAAQDFVTYGDKDALIHVLRGSGFETAWLASYRDKSIPTKWIIVASVVGLPAVVAPFVIIPGRPLENVVAVFALCGLILGVMLSSWLTGPRLERVNQRARNELLSRWEARLGAG